MPDLDAASSLTRHRSFVLFWCARTFTNGAFMMQGVAVGWQIYDLTNDPLDLGLVGLVQFFPLVVISIVAGQVLDLFDRRVVAGVCQVGKALAALALAVGTAQGWLDRESMFAILFLSGTARAFEIPTMHALLPGVVPMALLPRAIAASASAQQTAVICGPSLGGLLYGLGPATVYATCTAIFIAASVLISGVEIIAAQRAAPAGHAGDAVCRLCLYSQPSDPARRHLARSVRRSARRRHRAAADLRARHPARRTLGARAAALGARRRRARRIDRAGAPRHRRPCRPRHVRRGRTVRSREPPVRPVDVDRAVVPGARDLRRVRRRQRGHPPVAGADAHARTTCWAG